MRKIVIIPSFASSHFLKCWIPNMIEVIDPDVIAIHEGLFQKGPENRGHLNSEFRKKYCYDDTNAGFDWDETLELVDSWHSQGITIGCKIVDYKSDDANLAFVESVSDFAYFPNEYLPEIGDILFPLEPDAFLYEGDKDIIDEEISKLQPGEGLQCKWVDFLETQYYTEAINLVQPKYRRFCYCFDNMENYKEAINGFMSQSYPKLKKVDSFFIRHYCWFQPDPWKQLRYELIYRSDPQYWPAFDSGLDEIRRNSQRWENFMKTPIYGTIQVVDIKSDKIIIRPSRQDEGRYAKFIDVEHPRAIHSHSNFVK